MVILHYGDSIMGWKDVKCRILLTHALIFFFTPISGHPRCFSDQHSPSWSPCRPSPGCTHQWPSTLLPATKEKRKKECLSAPPKRKSRVWGISTDSSEWINPTVLQRRRSCWWLLRSGILWPHCPCFHWSCRPSTGHGTKQRHHLRSVNSLKERQIFASASHQKPLPKLSWMQLKARRLANVAASR